MHDIWGKGVISTQIQFLPPKQSLSNSSRPVGTVIVVIMLKLMLHSYSCVSCIVIRFFFPLLKFLFKCFFGARRLMTTCFPTEMFNQRLIRGTDTFSSADLIFHFPFWCPTFINLQSRGDEEGDVYGTLKRIFHALTRIGNKALCKYFLSDTRIL